MSVIRMTDLGLADKRVFIRVGLNIPIKEGKVVNDMRIRASLLTIGLALRQDMKAMITFRLGHPIEGEYNEELSLLPAINYLKDRLSAPVRLAKDYLDGVEIIVGELVVLENVRFNRGGKKGDGTLSKRRTTLCDVFVMDAFGTAHRAQASIHGIDKLINTACADPLLAAELDALGRALRKPARPMVAIVGGFKIPIRLIALDSLSRIADQLIVSGGIVNTFITAQGHNVGKSLYEANLVDETKRLLITCDIPVPTNVRVAIEFSGAVSAALKPISDVEKDEQVLNIDGASAQQLTDIPRNAKAILWSSPVGAFESPNFYKGAEIVASAIADSEAFFIAGDGDTLAAVDLFGTADKVSYASAGGGAFLEFVEGKILLAVVTLEECARKWAFNGQGNLPNYWCVLEHAPLPGPKVQDS